MRITLSTMFYRVGTAALIIWAYALPVLAGNNSCQGSNCLQNPLRFSSIDRFIEGTLTAIITIMLPVIAGFLVYAGFLYVSARGNSGQIKKAHENFYYVIIGTALILGAWVLATLIGGTIRQILG